MANIEIGMKITDVATASQQFADAVRQASQGIGDFTVKTISFNDKGEATSGVIQRMDAAGRKLSTTFDLTGRSAEVLGQKITDNAEASRKALERLSSEAAKIAGGQLGQASGARAAALFPLPDNASIAQTVRYSAAVAGVQRAVAGSGLSASQVNDLFNQAANGPRAFAQQLSLLPAESQRVGVSILSLASTAEDAANRGQTANNAWGVSFQGLFRILQVQLFRRGITTLVNSVRDGITSAIDYQVQLQQVANVTNQSGEGFDNLRTRVRGLSDEFGVNLPGVLSASQSALTSQLNNSADGFNVLTSAMRLSRATGIDFESANRLVSTSLQAFHLSGQDAASAANTLFLTSQRTRVPLNELQNAIGRVSQTAHGLGLSFEQVSALFLTVSQQGGRPTEAFALLNQVMGRLLNPTKELQRFLNDLGTPTAALAFKTFGLVGFLEKLNDAAAKSPEALGEIAGSMRTLRALLALTGDQTQAFQRNLEALGGSSDALARADREIARTPAQQITAQFQQIKNVFTEDIGIPFLNGLLKVVDGLGGATQAVIALTKAVATLAIGLAANRIATPLIEVALAIQAAIKATTALSFSFTNLGADATALMSNTAFAGGVATALIAIGTAFIFAVDQMERRDISQIVSRIEQIGRQGEQVSERLRTGFQRETAAYAEEVSRRFQRRFQDAAQAVQLANDVRAETIRGYQAQTQEQRVADQAYLDGLRRRLSETRSAAHQAETDILASRRNVENFEQQARQRTFRTQIGLEQDPAAAIRLIQDQRARLISEVRGVFTNPQSSREEIARARATAQEIQQLNDQLTQQQVEDQRRTAEATGVLPMEVRYGQVVRVFHADLTDSLRRESELVRLITDLETERQRRLNATAAAQNAVRQAQESQVRTFELLLRSVEGFRAFSESGRLLPEFQSFEKAAQGGGIRQALVQFDRLAERTRESARQQHLDIDVINGLLSQRRGFLQAEAAATQTVGNAQRNQVRTQEEANFHIEHHNDLLNQQQGFQQTLNTQLTQYEQALTNIQEFSRLQPRIEQDALQALSGRAREAATAWNQIKDAIDSAQQAENRFRQVRSPENLAALQDATVRLRDAVSSFSQAQFSRGEQRRAGLRTPFFGDLEPGTQRTDVSLFAREIATNQQTGLPALNNLLRQVGDSVVNIDRLGLALSGARDQMEQAANATEFLPRNLRAAGAAARELEAPLLNLLTNAGRNAQEVADQTERLVTNLRNLQRLNQNINIPQAAPPPDLPGFARGGPSGTDNILAWLSPGEFVVNAQQTRRFYSQLLSINAGIQPRYYAQGGPVSVGDIHVHVIGAQSEKTIREIGLGINREIRRGTIRFRSN